MVTDKQVRILMNLTNKVKTKAIAAARAGMDEKTARKYVKAGKLPSQLKVEHTWLTREDKFKEVWEELKGFLKNNAGLEAKTLFVYLQRKYPGKFDDGLLRTLQRRVKRWRALEGPQKEVYFPQKHHPGELSESDFTNMDKLGVTIQKELFRHLLFHFVLTYSNWETGTVCFSENFESLSTGLQNALWELGGVPNTHRTDRMSAAVNKKCNAEEFTDRYRALLGHYKIKGQSIQAGKANEDGDVEVSHRWYKNAIDQALMLRGSRDFESRAEYEEFIKEVFRQRNKNRREKFQEELKKLTELPEMRLDDCKEMTVPVSGGSTINVAHKIYSVNSRLIGEKVKVKLYAENLELWCAQKKIDTIPRLRGKKQHHIQYRHIINWLLRKPGAFENYKYKDDMFPTTRFRMAYDYLKDKTPAGANKEYLKILNLAAKETETGADEALTRIKKEKNTISAEAVETILKSKESELIKTDVYVAQTELSSYDRLINSNNIGLCVSDHGGVS